MLPTRDTDIYVADTLGELGLIYRLAPIVFMGGSLVRARRPEPDRGRQARRRDPARAACLEFRRDLRSARCGARRRAARRRGDALTARLGAWLTDAGARGRVAGRPGKRRWTSSAARWTARSPRSSLISMQIRLEQRQPSDA